MAIGARGEERLDAARASVDAAGDGRVTGTAVDIRDDASVHRWIDATADEFGGVHIVVANAGGPPAGAATASDLAAYRDAVDLSLLSHIGMVQAALPHLRRAAWGRVLFVTSTTVKEPIPNLALSSTARVAVVGYAKSLVADLGPAGITVNVLAPGYHRTPLVESSTTATRGASRTRFETCRSRRMGTPGEFGAVAAFLASEQAGYVTGTTIAVDGGRARGLL